MPNTSAVPLPNPSMHAGTCSPFHLHRPRTIKSPSAYGPVRRGPATCKPTPTTTATQPRVSGTRPRDVQARCSDATHRVGFAGVVLVGQQPVVVLEAIEIYAGPALALARVCGRACAAR
eukprot:1391134-Rhodomonas_salina.2